MEVHKVEISSLVFDPVNARKHDSRNLEAIKGSLTRFGQQKPIVVDAKGVVLAGNGTLAAAKALGWTEIWVKQSDLDTVNASAYSLADNRTAELAEWDDEILQQQLAALELAGFDISILDFDLPSEEEGGGLDGDYTAKIEAPIYTPKGDKPALSELVDCSKAQELSEEINRADIPDDVKDFLLYAAGRHRVFHYQNIAEYYCHAPKPVQELMEKSALVVIDFKKAIEYGFVKMSKDIAEVVKNEEQ